LGNKEKKLAGAFKHKMHRKSRTTQERLTRAMEKTQTKKNPQENGEIRKLYVENDRRERKLRRALGTL